MTPLRRFVLFAAGLLIVACTGGDESSDVVITPLAGAAAEDADATPAPGLALTPQSGLRVDMDTARRLESEGDIESAAAAYVAIAAGETEERDAATLDAARLLLELERPDDVRLLLEPFLTRNGLLGDDRAAHYLLARAYAARRMWAESLEQYDRYIELGRPALPYAYLDRSIPLLELDRLEEAVASVEQGLSLGVPASQRRAFLLRLAESNERAGMFGEAISWYRALIEEGLSGDAALALSRIVALKRLQDDPTYIDELIFLLTTYPISREALANLEEALQAGDPIAPWVQGLVYYRHNDHANAEPAFQEQIALAPDDPTSAEAHYYLAAIQEARGEIASSLANYERATELNPESPVADDAIWWRARILALDEALDAARVLYQRIVDDYPASQFVPDAAFQRGLLEYRRGDFEKAGAAWAESAGLSSGLDRAHLEIWQAKALLNAGAKDAAQPVLERLADEFEDDYPGVRARALLEQRHEIPRADREEVDLIPDFDWDEAEQWLQGRTGREISDAAWSSNPGWRRAQELWRVGRTSYGDAEVFDLIELYAGDAVAMYTLSRRLDELGRISMSGRAGQRLLRALDTDPNEGLPKALLALSYPAPFAPLVKRHADEHGVSPLLMLAFIRQESFFDPRAISPASARGLTQVIPATARAIASELDVQDFRLQELLHADLNLRFGAKYMADQLEDFDEELFVAFAAYNAGPTAAGRWREASGNDADLFLEVVEFHETKLYVEIVAENYAIYRYVYGGQPEPNLPD